MWLDAPIRRVSSIFFIVSMALVMVSACGDSQSEATSDAVAAPATASQLVQITLSGSVKDHFTSEPIAGAEITAMQYLGSDSESLGATATDGAGAYKMKVNAYLGRINLRAESSNYVPQSDVFTLTEGGDVFPVSLVMVPMGAAKIFQPSEAVEIWDEEQDRPLVSLSANSLVTVSGDVPAGAAEARVTVLDPSEDTGLMPGDFMARSASGDGLNPIESFGALNVRLEDDQGSPLNLDAGQEAVISIPLATNIDPLTAPSTMPLYYWSDEVGAWIQEGGARLEEVAPGRWSYVGAVSHFTTWNADMQFDTVDISGCVEGGEEIPKFLAVKTIGVDYIGDSLALVDAKRNFKVPARVNSKINLDLKAEPFSSRILNTTTVSIGNEDIELDECLVIPSGQAPESQEGDEWNLDGLKAWATSRECQAELLGEAYLGRGFSICAPKGWEIQNSRLESENLYIDSAMEGFGLAPIEMLYWLIEAFFAPVPPGIDGDPLLTMWILSDSIEEGMSLMEYVGEDTEAVSAQETSESDLSYARSAFITLQDGTEAWISESSTEQDEFFMGANQLTVIDIDDGTVFTVSAVGYDAAIWNKHEVGINASLRSFKLD